MGLATGGKLTKVCRAMEAGSTTNIPTPVPARTRAAWRMVLLGLLWLLWLIPVVQTIYLSETCTSPSPLWDDWKLVGKYLAKSLDGHPLTWEDYWEPYVHSRAPVPKAVCLTLARISHWNVKMGTRATLLLTLVSLGSVFWLIRRKSSFTRWEQPLVAAAAAFLIFNPFQQTPWYFSVMASNALGLTPVIVCTVLWTTRVRFGPKVAISLALTLVASLSMITGLVLWLIPPFLMWWTAPKPSRRALLATTLGWLALFAGFLLFYFHDFHASQHSMGLGTAVTRSRDILDFVLTMLGYTAGFYPSVPPTAGVRLSAVLMANSLLVMLLAVVGLNSRFFFSGAGFRQALPWLVLAGYGVVYSLMVTLNQLDVGNAEFLTRYAAYTAFFYLGILGLVRLGLQQAFLPGAASSPGRRAATWGLAAAGLALLVTAITCTGLSYQQGLRKSGEVYFKGATSRGAIQFSQVCPDWNMLNDAAWSNAEAIIEYSPPIAAAGFLQPGLVMSPLLAENVRFPLGNRGNQYHGAFEKLAGKGGAEVYARGWAIEHNGMPPDLVVLTAHPAGSEQEERVVSISMDRVKRKDIAKRFRYNMYTGRYGWSVEVKLAKLPPGNCVLRAYAFDTETLAFHRLAEEKTYTNLP